MKIKECLFGHENGEQIIEYTLINDSNMSVSCLNYGCVITKIMVPDKTGNIENIVLGLNDFEEYKKYSPYFGAVVGRVAGRIKNAKFELDGKEYQLTKNESSNHIHGGKKGFSFVVWKAEKIEKEDAVGLKFTYRSEHGEEGYPGNVDIIVTYLLHQNNELYITYEATADQKTIMNITNHSYFNLSGNNKRDCLGHSLQFDSDYFLELDNKNIPTGTIHNTKDTPFDFRKKRFLKDGVESSYPQTVLVGNGYDHPIVFPKKEKNKIELRDEESGRTMIVTTDQPCVVLYTGNKLRGPYSVSGVPIRPYLGVCLETQGFPDAINHLKFPTTILEPGERYYSKSSYRFFWK